MGKLKGGQLLIDVSSEDIRSLEVNESTTQIDLLPMFNNIVSSHEYDEKTQMFLDELILSKTITIKVKFENQSYNILLNNIKSSGSTGDNIVFDFVLYTRKYMFRISNLLEDNASLHCYITRAE